LTIPGIVAVNSWGGPTKQFEVEADPHKLEAYNITVPQLLTSLGNANINVGGREIRIRQQSVNIRLVGLMDDGGNDDSTTGYKLEDIENVVLTQTSGVPVLVEDVAKVQVGYPPRLGIWGPDSAQTTHTEPRGGWTDRLRLMLVSAVQVDKAIFFSAAITVAGFVPLFTMQGGRGPDFRPHGAHLRLCARWSAAGHRHRRRHARRPHPPAPRCARPENDLSGPRRRLPNRGTKNLKNPCRLVGSRNQRSL
jgi:Cu/Ag efflux pump CusA